MEHSILALDVSGTPRKWINAETAVCYHAKELVVWSLGDPIVLYRGGYNTRGERSIVTSPSIIAVRGKDFIPAKFAKVALTNRALFARDRGLCAYCGKHYDSVKLSRDHIVPVSRGGVNKWTNVVTACKKCNTVKNDQTLDECNMHLLYVPYEPNHYENLILQNRRILADQMEYLMAGVPKHSRILKDHPLLNA